MMFLVVGGGGQLGSKLVEQASKTHEVYASYVSREPRLRKERKVILDKRDKTKVDETLARLVPEVVIDTAALHNVDYCESHQAEAWAINVEGSKNLAEAAMKIGAKIVYISTDYVFDGAKGNYTERDAPNPISYYGVTKTEAEKAVAAANKNHLIIRPALVYSWVNLSSSTASASGKPLNFAMWAVQKLSNAEPIKIVDDQFASPTLADSLAGTVLHAIERELTGLYHIAGKDRMNRYQFTQKLAEHLHLDKKLITPTKSADLKQVAKRPLDSSLNVEKIEHDLKTPMPHIDQSIEIFARQAREMPIK